MSAIMSWRHNHPRYEGIFETFGDVMRLVGWSFLVTLLISAIAVAVGIWWMR